MTIKECYNVMGSDYDDVIKRLRSEAFIKKFCLKFMEDKNFEKLADSIATENYDEAFIAAHTIKGICVNLSFTKLAASSTELTEALRNKTNADYKALFNTVEKDYETTVKALKMLQ